jgi:hypothetical protein
MTLLCLFFQPETASLSRRCNKMPPKHRFRHYLLFEHQLPQEKLDSKRLIREEQCRNASRHWERHKQIKIACLMKFAAI